MNSKNTTIIICCAGMGTRLGIGTTKALVNICGKPLILYMLEQLKEYDDIRVVIGFQANEVIETIKKYRQDIMFVFNYEYETTGPAASMSKALIKCRENLIILDGDLIVNPLDFKKFLNCGYECIPYTKATSDEPVYIQTNNEYVVNFLKEKNDFEWPGMVKVKRDKIKKSDGFIFDILVPILPLKTMYVRAMEIDTQDDYERVLKWVENNFE